MGLVKGQWIEAEERGWVEIEKNVCEGCVAAAPGGDLLQIVGDLGKSYR